MENLVDETIDTDTIDKEAVEQGSHIKYVLEYYNDKQKLVDILNFYTDKYYDLEEFVFVMGQDIQKEELTVDTQGPFELYEQSFDNAKIERYIWEKSQVNDDKKYVSSQKTLYSGKYKYLYVSYIKLFDINRVFGCTASNYALRPYQINQMLKIPFGSNPEVIRTNLTNSEIKTYV